MDATQARSFYEECLSTIYVRQQLERLADYYAPNVIAHPDIPGVPAGIAGVELTTRGFFSMFSEPSLRFEDFTQEGDTFRVGVRAQVTHSGEFMGVAPTGRRVELVSEHRFRLQGGKIIECWTQSDPTQIQRQLGASPAA